MNDSGPHTRASRVDLVGLAVTLSPLAVAVVVLAGVGQDYLPTADIALTELRARDIGRHAVLLGPYSREGWNHPGPALFYALAVPYRLSGSQGIGLAIGALVVNGAAIAGMALVARRVAGLVPMLLTLIGCSVIVGALGPEVVRDPWNPYITVLPFGLLLFLAWAMTCGARWALPIGAGVASYCMQTHIGYVPLALPLMAWGAGWLVVIEWRRAAGEPAREWMRRLAPSASVALVLLAIMWLAPAAQQVRAGPGNLTEVLRYFRESEEGTPTLVEALRAVGGQFAPVPQWVTGDIEVNSFTSEPRLLDSNPFPVLVLAFALGAVVLWRRGCRTGAKLSATLVVALVAGIFSIARTLGPAFAYRLRWTWLFGMVAMVVAGWALSEVVAKPRSGRRVLAFGAAGLLVALAGSNAIRAAGVDSPYEESSRVMRSLTPSLQRALPPDGDGPAILVETTSFGGTFYKSGIFLWLEHQGVDAGVDMADEDAYGGHRLLRKDGSPPVVWTVAVNQELDVVAARPGQQLIAYWGVQTSAERDRLGERSARLEVAHAAGLYDDVEYLERARALDPGRAVAVFASRPAA